jgi:predicted amidohydrolase YtcJ
VAGGGVHSGAAADLIILSGNPLATPLDGLRDLEVLATIAEGRITWAAERLRRELR